MKRYIALSTVVLMGAALASASVAEARFRGGGGFHRHRTVIVEQPTIGLGVGLGVGLLGLLAAQQTFAQPAQIIEEPRVQRLPREPKLRDNPIPLK